ncbi:MAG: hypothetical protein WCT28_02355 [Patescibacteria group bacterium]|jgi:hypothetical protein
MSFEIIKRFQRLPNIPENKKASWRWFADEEEIFPRRHLVGFLDLPNRPQLVVTYGWIDDGNFAYDGIAHTSFGGGGVLVIPFVIANEELWVFTIRQYRLFTGQKLLTFPRGYKPSGVSFAQHAATELAEELGQLKPGQINGKQFSLSDTPTWSSSHIIDWRPLPDEESPGEYQFGIELNEQFMTFDEEGRPMLAAGTFAPGDPLEAVTMGEAKLWWEIAAEREGCLGGSMLRLMAWLRKHRGMRF